MRAAGTIVLLLLVATGVLLVLRERGGRPVQEAAAGPQPSASPDDAHLEDVARELASLRRSVDELAAAVRDARLEAPAPARVLAEGGPAANDELLRELRAMEARLANLLRDADDAGGGPIATGELLERIKAPDAFPDWAAWKPIVDLWHQDREAARKEVKLLTAEQVLERFGAPTDVWSNTNGITWQYARDWDAVRERYGLEIILRIPDGYVTQLVVR